MKADELMIGDWVYNTHNKKAERVVEIREDGVMLDYNDIYPYDEIEPIPLTAEILEKNGFINEEIRVLTTPFLRQRAWCKVQVFEFKPFYRAKQEINRYRLMIGGKDSSGIDIHINYVHELQHALRLCGIDKKIEL
jgi:hypothetical protein